MNPTTNDAAVLRAALEAEDHLFNHTRACPHCTDVAICDEAKRLYQHSEQLRRVALGHETGKAELDTVVRTAESIVHDILMYATVGRVDDDAQAAFRDWIVEAMLTQPTARQIDALCRAAGFAGPVNVETMTSRIDQLHETIDRQMHELSQRTTHIHTLHAAGQAVIDNWEHGDLASAVRNLAALLPKPSAV